MQSWLGARVRPFKLFLLPFLCTLRNDLHYITSDFEIPQVVRVRSFDISEPAKRVLKFSVAILTISWHCHSGHSLSSQMSRDLQSQVPLMWLQELWQGAAGEEDGCPSKWGYLQCLHRVLIIFKSKTNQLYIGIQYDPVILTQKVKSMLLHNWMKYRRISSNLVSFSSTMLKHPNHSSKWHRIAFNFEDFEIFWRHISGNLWWPTVRVSK